MRRRDRQTGQLIRGQSNAAVRIDRTGGERRTLGDVSDGDRRGSVGDCDIEGNRGVLVTGCVIRRHGRNIHFRFDGHGQGNCCRCGVAILVRGDGRHGEDDLS